MNQPEGFNVPGREKEVCLLKKSLYGLKQASRTWNKTFDSFLVNYGLSRSSADPCVYYQASGEETTIVAVWVDDGLVCSTPKTIGGEIVEHLATRFEMTSGPAECFVGIQITRDRPRRQMFLSQSNYFCRILKKFCMTDCKPHTTPADPHGRLTTSMGPTDDQEFEDMSAVPYRQAVGSLIHAVVATRPDIAFAVGQVSQFCQDPGRAHWNGVKRILAYLIGTINHGLCFSGSAVNSLMGYSDADFAGDTDTRRSVTGYVFMMNGGAVAWCSRRQRGTSVSTTESEYVALFEASKEAVWMRSVLRHIGFNQEIPTPLLCDNQSAIKLIFNPEFHKRTKHIDVKYHFIREKQQDGTINVEYVDTTLQLADIFTKPLDAVRFRKLRHEIGVQEIHCIV